MDRITGEKASHVQADDKARQRRKFQKLHTMQHPAPSADNRRTLINRSNVPLRDAAYLTLGKVLNYALAPVVLPIEDFLRGVEKAIGFLSEEDAEEVRQETLRIVKSSTKPKDNLSVAERRPLPALRTNADLTVLPADKSNAAVVLNTKDHKQRLRPF
jgi:hypothetical protein